LDEQAQASWARVREAERLALQAGEIVGRIVIARHYADHGITVAIDRQEHRAEFTVLFLGPGKFIALKDAQFNLPFGQLPGQFTPTL
jgi:hypothetical protein